MPRDRNTNARSTRRPAAKAPRAKRRSLRERASADGRATWVENSLFPLYRQKEGDTGGAPTSSSFRGSRECLREFLDAVHQDVRVGPLQCVRGEAVSDTDAPEVRIASSENVDCGVANHNGLFRRGTSFRHKHLCAEGIGLFRLETVAAICLKEVLRQAESGKDVTRGPYRLVGQDSQLTVQAIYF